jgi:hypothetical protein
LRYPRSYPSHTLFPPLEKLKRIAMAKKKQGEIDNTKENCEEMKNKRDRKNLSSFSSRHPRHRFQSREKFLRLKNSPLKLCKSIILFSSAHSKSCPCTYFSSLARAFQPRDQKKLIYSEICVHRSSESPARLNLL